MSPTQKLIIIKSKNTKYFKNKIYDNGLNLFHRNLSYIQIVFHRFRLVRQKQASVLGACSCFMHSL